MYKAEGVLGLITLDFIFTGSMVEVPAHIHDLYVFIMAITPYY